MKRLGCGWHAQQQVEVLRSSQCTAPTCTAQQQVEVPQERDSQWASLARSLLVGRRPMGCGASRELGVALPAPDVARAGAMATPASPGTVAESAAAAAVGSADAAAAVTTAASSALASAPGELLLGVAQHLPFVAPVAFLIGAVISAAGSAKTLKADCAEFSKFVASIEAVCQEAALQGTLDRAEEAVAQLRSALEGGL